MVDDPNLVEKVNEHLSPQIRIWNIQVTNKSFSCYLMCDSRVYEYLLPSHCLLPPHPKSFMGRKILEFAEKEGDMEAYKARQEEVATFWDDVNENYIKPVLEKIPEDIRDIVEKAFLRDQQNVPENIEPAKETAAKATAAEGQEKEPEETTAAKGQEKEPEESGSEQRLWPSAVIRSHPRKDEIIQAMKAVKAAYLQAKHAYRVPFTRIMRLQSALDKYIGTKNFYNYTIQKQFRDPSAKRHIKSFKVNPEPVIINGTEWYSLKVHGQSFMMHQIRKMVSMAVQVVRCGCDPVRIDESFGRTRIGIPKAPSLGLLLERPVFDVFNKKAANLGRDEIGFDKYEKEINEFKEREIYTRIFNEEAETHPYVFLARVLCSEASYILTSRFRYSFYSFFNHIDSYPQEAFLYVTSGGLPAARLDTPQEIRKEKLDRRVEREALAAFEGDSDDEGDIPDNGEEGG